MKIFSGIVGFIILVLVLCFALTNRQSVTVGMWPFADAVQSPLYLVGFVPLAVGVVFGGIWGWLGHIPHRLRARRLHKELGVLNDRIGELQKSALAPPLPVASKRKWWRPQP